MPSFGPIKRKDLIKGLRHMGFEGPYSGGKHQYMVKEDITLFVPNPHEGDIGRDLLARLLRQARISKAEWKKI